MAMRGLGDKLKIGLTRMRGSAAGLLKDLRSSQRSHNYIDPTKSLEEVAEDEMRRRKAYDRVTNVYAAAGIGLALFIMVDIFSAIRAFRVDPKEAGVRFRDEK